MKEITIETKMQLCQFEELTEEQQQLVKMACDATQNSYSPYSKFRVGSALRMADGTIRVKKVIK